MKKILLLIGACVLGMSMPTKGWSQDALKFFLYFKDKDHNTYTLEKPEEFLSERALQRRSRQNITLSERDLPVSDQYIAALRAQNVEVLYASKWLNGVLVKVTEEELKGLLALEFVSGYLHAFGQLETKELSESYHKESLPLVKPQSNAKLNYGYSFDQVSMLNADQMHEDGFAGQGIQIAVLDAGFYKVNSLSAFDSLFANDQILGTYDFVDAEENVYDDHRHGMQVLSCLAGYSSEGLIGTAYKADYYLFRTEDFSTETRLEEINWLIAAEKADSLGVDIISSSLGYNTFDYESQNYTHENLDGNTAIITQAADLAAATGMLVVTSAGNEGNDPWKKITAPADADSVLSIGAVDRNNELAFFSSVGPTADGRIKPDVVALGVGTVVNGINGNIATNSGTSFSAPLVAGLAAGIWQANPQLTNMDLIFVIKESASMAHSANSKLGFGIPGYTNATEFIKSLSKSVEGLSVYPNPIQDAQLTIRFPRKVIGKPCKVAIYSTDAKSVLQSEIVIQGTRHTFQIPAVMEAAGPYILRIDLEGEVETFRLLKN
ncbi:S8 family serine peptidase [Rapidithrix thailandica]|uniref:S8 family serine peptidase n=1 Tax=Rapidithrix thailandica TaxID=413964 RepID=A0AAW9S4X4_9BACT